MPCAVLSSHPAGAGRRYVGPAVDRGPPGSRSRVLPRGPASVLAAVSRLPGWPVGSRGARRRALGRPSRRAWLGRCRAGRCRCPARRGWLRRCPAGRRCGPGRRRRGPRGRRPRRSRPGGRTGRTWPGRRRPGALRARSGRARRRRPCWRVARRPRRGPGGGAGCRRSSGPRRSRGGRPRRRSRLGRGLDLGRYVPVVKVRVVHVLDRRARGRGLGR